MLRFSKESPQGLVADQQFSNSRMGLGARAPGPLFTGGLLIELVDQIGIFAMPIDEGVDAEQPPSIKPLGFNLRIIPAQAVASDGLAKLEFDARTWLEKANDESLILLLEEWFQGDGPGCRRVLDGTSVDTQVFCAYVDSHSVGWTLRIDGPRAIDWIRQRRPALTNYIQPEMIFG